MISLCVKLNIGSYREANLMMMGDDEVKVGDFVLIHVGFVMNKIDEEGGLKSQIEDLSVKILRRPNWN